jgi:serine phosphatase RsbU (regulator of sigma subunit)
MLVLAGAEGVAGITAGATVIAALIIALVTARTTNSRQERQLEAEAERQKDELAAEAERQREELDERTDGQKRQLNHDRQLHDLADLRTVLDGAALALDNAEDAIIGVSARGDISQDEYDALKECSAVLGALRARLYVRLGPSHPISDHIHNALVAVLKAQNAALTLMAHPDVGLDTTKEAREILDHSGDSLGAARNGFVAAAVESAGTVIPAP